MNHKPETFKISSQKDVIQIIISKNCSCYVKQSYKSLIRPLILELRLLSQVLIHHRVHFEQSILLLSNSTIEHRNKTIFRRLPNPIRLTSISIKVHINQVHFHRCIFLAFFHPFFSLILLHLPHYRRSVLEYSQKKLFSLSRKRANLGRTGITMSLALTEKQLNSLDQSNQIERQLTALINTSLAQGKFFLYVSFIPSSKLCWSSVSFGRKVLRT